MVKVVSYGQPMSMRKKKKVVHTYKLGNSLARLIPQLVVKAKTVVRDLDKDNDLKFMRLKTAKN